MQERDVRGELLPPSRENKGQAGTSGAQSCTASRSDCFARLSRRIKCTKAPQSSVCAPHTTATPRNKVARQHVIRHRSYVLAGWLARCPPLSELHGDCARVGTNSRVALCKRSRESQTFTSSSRLYLLSRLSSTDRQCRQGCPCNGCSSHQAGSPIQPPRRFLPPRLRRPAQTCGERNTECN